MAIFIPGLKPEDFNNSYGEKKVYEALRSLNDKYSILYSFSWVGVNANRTIGEADFVILHPDMGILVIEVKSGEIEYRDREWIQTNTSSRVSKRIEPFIQARKSQFELLDRLRKADLPFTLPMLCYCVWFPSVDMPSEDKLPAEASKEIVLDKTSLDNPERAIENCFEYWSTKYRTAKLDSIQFQRVIDTLCPHFHVIPRLKNRIEETDASYIQLTNQQAALLDYLEEQKTAAIHGLAGTGKTALAVEKAKKLAKDREQVLFLCYNSFLRDMLKQSNAIPNVTFHNAHSLAYEIMGGADTPDRILEEFEDFLEEVFDAESWKYSNIIIDEGQDLDDRLLNRLCELVKQKNGCFYVFYDRNQHVLNNQAPNWIESCECRLVLHKNCRNTAEVFKTSCSILGIDTATYNEVHGEIPAARFYKTTNELEAIVNDFIKRVTTEGIPTDEIVILTTRTIEKSWLSLDKEYFGYKLSTTSEEGRILFTTIRKFKGLEADAILIIDANMSGLLSIDYKRLLYVGSSRAKNILNLAMLEDIETGEMSAYIRDIAPDRNVPKNKRGLKRLLNITIKE